MKYYFVSYAHEKGFGNFYSKTPKDISMKEWRDYAKKISKTNSVIINFFRITKKEFEIMSKESNQPSK